MKRLLAGWLVILMLFTMIPLSAVAADQTISLRLELSNPSAMAGERFTVSVYMDNPIPISTLQYKLTFDSDALTYVSRVNGPWVIDSEFTAVSNAVGNEVRLGGFDSGGNGDYLITGRLITITFEVKATATAGFKPFNIIDFDMANGTGTIDYGNGKGVEGLVVDATEATNVAFRVQGLRLKADAAPVAASSVYGTLLSGIAFTGGSIVPLDTADTTEVTGSWAWKEPSTLPTVDNNGYFAVFTPDASFNQYEPIEINVEPTIIPKPITVAVAAASKIYGKTNPVFMATCDDLVEQDTIDLLGLMLSSAATPLSDVGFYNVTSATGIGVNGNYNVSLDGTNKLEIIQATAQSIQTVTPSAITKTAYEARGCVDIDAIVSLAELPLTVELMTNGGAAELPIAWSSIPTTVNPQGAAYTLLGTLTGNDNIANGDVTLSIPVTITEINATKPLFGEETIFKSTNVAAKAADLPVLLPTNGNVVVEGESIAYAINWNGGETLDLTTAGAATTFTGVISYPGIPAWLTVPTELAISRKITVMDKLVVSVTLGKPADVIYGQEVVIPAASAPEAGSSPHFIYTYSGTPVDGSAAISDSVTKPKKAGNYTVTAVLDDQAFTGSVTQPFTINRKPLAATVDDATKVYGEENPVFKLIFDGFEYSDTEEDLNVLTLNTTVTETSPVGNYEVVSSAGVGNNGNYIVSFDGKNKLTVTKKQINVTADNANRDYLAANPVFTFTHDILDLVGDDTKEDLCVVLSADIDSFANAGEYPDRITGTSTSMNYNVTVIPGMLTIRKINQFTPVEVSLSKTSAIAGVTTGISAMANGGNGTGAFVFESMQQAVAEIDRNTGEITLIDAGTVEINVVRIGDQNYYDSDTSEAAVLNVVPKIELITSNTMAGGTHLINAKNQPKVRFDTVVRDGETNNFTLSINGLERLESYESINENQGEGIWVGALIGKKGVEDISTLWVKTANADAFTQLTADDVEEAANAGGTDSFVYWFKVTDSGIGSTHKISIASDDNGEDESQLTIVFTPFVEPIRIYKILLNSSDNGTVSGGGEYEVGTMVTLKAVPNRNYTFNGWHTEDGTKISDANPYIFEVDGEYSLTAKFVYVGGSSSGNGNSSNGGSNTSSGEIKPNNGDLETAIKTVNIENEEIPAAPVEQEAQKISIPELDKNRKGGYLSGYPDNTMRATNEITRYETVSIFYSLILDANKASFEQEISRFSDVDAGQWYSKAVGYLLSKGMLSGYEDGTFKGNNPITRAEFVTIVSKFCALSQTDTALFEDVSPNHWAYKFVQTVYNNGWITGYPDGTFAPDKMITRAEAVVVVNKMLGWDVNSASEGEISFADLIGNEWYYKDMVVAVNGVNS